MPYNFTAAANADTLAIPELYYATAAEVRFTIFTSCIGLVALHPHGNTVTGIHLAMFSPDDTPFNNMAAGVASGLLGAYTRVLVIGMIDIWVQTPAYHHLLTLLHDIKVVPRDDGIYGGRIHGVSFQYYEGHPPNAGHYVNVP